MHEMICPDLRWFNNLKQCCCKRYPDKIILRYIVPVIDLWRTNVHQWYAINDFLTQKHSWLYNLSQRTDELIIMLAQRFIQKVFKQCNYLWYDNVRAWIFSCILFNESYINYKMFYE